MRKSYHKLLLMLCVAFATPVSYSKESPTLHWVKNDAPPFYIVDNDCQQGFGDQVQTVLEKRLKNYRHSTLFVPLSRLEHTWQEYNPLCFVTMIHEKPVNNEYLLSMPNAMYLPHGIITTNRFADTLPLQADGTLALEELLEHRKVTMGHIAGRTYSEKLDSILRRQRKNIEINSRAGATETQGILTMLSLGRFDFVIEYEFVLNHYVDSADYADQLRFIPISETRGDFILGAVGCSNSEAGQLAIKHINEALPELVQSRAYRRAVANWLVPVGDEVHYWNRFDKVLEDYLGHPVKPKTTLRQPIADQQN
ncbi:TIGR02285 family protein [uncultured Thalassolituus sp.]|uniref:TIGR02285 family protein n=1 Tax=uncultured Thalassolituus sp. TaxID=285273 RepID=UPI00260E7D2F|nr:TIGR02285 family protein [uncultured Thalassolituus sp.]